MGHGYRILVAFIFCADIGPQATQPMAHLFRLDQLDDN